MPRGLLGRKVGMTQVFTPQGEAIPVTVIECGPCVVLQVRTPERDGYSAVQLGFADKPRRLASRAERGHVAAIDSKRQKALSAAGVAVVEKANCEPKKYVREFRVTPEQATQYSVGQVLTVAGVFGETKHVDVIGTSKGRGFAGVMKRHNFHGTCASHGVKKVHRSGGSTGQSTDPGKVFKGTKMPGHFGNERVTVRRLEVIRADEENGVLLVRGAVPGYSGGFVRIRETNCK
ncbi:MAG: 50S ribosomal protein L3 [Planctomyces sp.]|nr:50S ribosomal protein L3 [Planctomyces sp.]